MKEWWKSLKLFVSDIILPYLISENKNTPNTENIEWIKKYNAAALIIAGIEKTAVSINFLSPLNYFTKRNNLTALKILNPLPISNPLSFVIKSIIEIITIIKSN